MKVRLLFLMLAVFVSLSVSSNGRGSPCQKKKLIEITNCANTQSENAGFASILVDAEYYAITDAKACYLPVAKKTVSGKTVSIATSGDAIDRRFRGFSDICKNNDQLDSENLHEDPGLKNIA